MSEFGEFNLLSVQVSRNHWRISSGDPSIDRLIDSVHRLFRKFTQQTVLPGRHVNGVHLAIYSIVGIHLICWWTRILVTKIWLLLFKIANIRRFFEDRLCSSFVCAIKF